MRFIQHARKASVSAAAIGTILVSVYLSSCGGSSGSSDTPIVTAGSTLPGAAGNTTQPGTSSNAPFGLDGYTQCGAEYGPAIDLKGVKTHLAYGNTNAFVYLFNQTGVVNIDADTFGSDPIFGTSKLVYCKKVVEGADAPAFAAALAKIKSHLKDEAALTTDQINQQASQLAQTMYTLVDTEATLAEAVGILALYEAKEGVFFVGAKTKGSFPNTPGASDTFALSRAVFALQQAIFDLAYKPDMFAKYAALLGKTKFNTSSFYPGSVKAPADPSKTYTAKINASMPKNVGVPTAFSSTPARRPTGYYLAAGDVATITVPQSMVNKSFTIQVGAHKQDKNGSNPVKRFFRISNQFPITSTVTKVANPFGGGIYINTPYLADAGIVNIQINNAVPAPFFAATAHNTTTLADWLATQRNNPAPWADFESDKFLMQVPSNFINKYADPVTLMADWDKRMDAVSQLIGQPLVRNNAILYIQPDTDIMFSGYGIGYPAINNPYNPADPVDGNKKVWYLEPGKVFWPTEFHELGHAQLFSNFPGEGEAAVNLLSAAISSKVYGDDIDLAFAKSFDNATNINREQAALNWMVTPNFRAGKAMDISNTTKDEVRYQHRGWAKYIEIAALFGWSALEDFYKEENRVADLVTKPASDGLSGVDSRIFRLSKSAGADLTALVHFWGVQPTDNAKLSLAMTSAGLKPSALVYDRLVKYQSIIPIDNAAFKVHAATFMNRPVASITQGPSPDYGEGWYFVWLNQYNATHGQEAQAAMAAIIAKYFPAGRP